MDVNKLPLSNTIQVSQVWLVSVYVVSRIQVSQVYIVSVYVVLSGMNHIDSSWVSIDNGNLSEDSIVKVEILDIPKGGRRRREDEGGGRKFF